MAHYRLETFDCIALFPPSRHFNGYLMAHEVLVIDIVSNRMDRLRTCTHFMTSYGRFERAAKGLKLYNLILSILLLLKTNIGYITFFRS